MQLAFLNRDRIVLERNRPLVALLGAWGQDDLEGTAWSHDIIRGCQNQAVEPGPVLTRTWNQSRLLSRVCVGTQSRLLSRMCVGLQGSCPTLESAGLYGKGSQSPDIGILP